MTLPIFQTKIQELSLMQTSWASILNPLLKTDGATSNVTQEYAWNSANVTAALGSNTVSFGHGAVGTPLLAYNSTTGANNRTMFTCRFKNPFQPTDVLFLEFLIQSNPYIWMDSLNAGVGWTVQNNTFFGAVIIPVANSRTDVQVWFGNGGYGPGGNVTYGTTGALWSGLPGRWRVRKMSFS